MNEVTGPVRPRRSILSAVAAFGALVVCLAIASVASAASSPVTGGSTSLALKKGFSKKLKSSDVKVVKSGSAKVKGRTVELAVSGGEVDSAAGQGSIRHAGGFKLKSPAAAVSITEIEIDLSAGAVVANVGGRTMRLGNLKSVSSTSDGPNDANVSGTVKLTGKSAKAINGALGLDRGLKGGEAMSGAKTKATVKPAAKAAAPPAPESVPPAELVPPTYPATNVKTMSRNLYLGAVLTPAILAPNLEAFVAANGKILREVTHNNFPTRAKGLAHEILEKEPDLVGLQEAALWRTAPVNFEVLEKGPSATTVRYDYLAELLAELNKEGTKYEVVVVQPEFDLEAPADENTANDTDNSKPPYGADINGRLTMRDAILKRVGAGVETWNAEGGNFKTPLEIPILGHPFAIKRGWVDTDASVRGSRPFHFVNTHLESFEPHIRAAQAVELIEPPGPAVSSLPVILVGDLNSDDNTVPDGAERWAFNNILAAGFVDRSTESPLGCCINSSELGEGDGGSTADFTQHIDHVMTNSPSKVLLLNSEVTGRNPVNGYWDSDHAGMFSSLELLP
jgi:hypothetical protein